MGDISKVGSLRGAVAFCKVLKKMLVTSFDSPLIEEVVKRLHQGKQDMEVVRKRHECSITMCNPQTERDIIGPNVTPLSSNIYLCRYGVVHICSQETCDLYQYDHRQTCNISGVQYGQLESTYDKNDFRTWRNKAEAIIEKPVAAAAIAKAKRVAKQPKAGDLFLKAQNLVAALLYSDTRAQLNAAQAQVYADRARKDNADYVAQRARIKQLPYLSECVSIIRGIKSLPLPFIEYQYSQYQVDYYASIIMQVRGLSKQYLPNAKVSFEEVCLGTLYTMGQGLRINKHDLLVKDLFLDGALPPFGLLSHFGIRRDRVTAGRTHLVMLYTTALGSDVAPEMLMLRLRELPDPKSEIYVMKKL